LKSTKGGNSAAVKKRKQDKRQREKTGSNLITAGTGLPPSKNWKRSKNDSDSKGGPMRELATILEKAVGREKKKNTMMTERGGGFVGGGWLLVVWGGDGFWWRWYLCGVFFGEGGGRLGSSQ